jgi:DNA-binding NtrC family response regulator
MQTPQLLLIDDDADTSLSLLRNLKAHGLEAEAHLATSAIKGVEMARQVRPHVYLLDLSLDDRIGPQSGFDLLQELVALDPSARIIVLTGHSNLDIGVRALSAGAASFLEKPPEINHLLALIHDGVKQAEMVRQYAARATTQSPHALDQTLVGKSDLVKQLRDEISYASQTNQAVFLQGETGTGKGVCAELIHDLSTRAGRRFVRYQPTFSSADLVNSDLFGHIRGAFTGATDSRKGLLAEADGGTFFLDEITELPLENQVTLLGVLQEKRFRPVGGSKEMPSDFRLISASNQAIDAVVQAGKFRADLLHRVAHLRITLPPLRERIADIPEISATILKTITKREHIAVDDIDVEALRTLQAHNWPGNIRELEVKIETAAYRAQFAQRRIIQKEDFGFLTGSTSPIENFHDRVEAYKRRLIEEALQKASGNQVQAAKDLGLDRSSMRRILARNA